MIGPIGQTMDGEASKKPSRTKAEKKKKKKGKGTKKKGTTESEVSVTEGFMFTLLLLSLFQIYF
jgi:hypothetical protein